MNIARLICKVLYEKGSDTKRKREGGRQGMKDYQKSKESELS